MKRIIFFTILSSTLFFSCEKEYTNNCGMKDLNSEWKLVAEYYDPGNGSGSYQSVVSDRTIRLYTDGTFDATGDVCFMGTSSNGTSEGLYVTGDQYLSTTTCSETKVYYTLSDTELILSYPCIEPCRQKYIRIQ